MARLVIYRSRSIRRNQRWRWKLIAENGNVLCVSSEGYANRQVCTDIALGILNGNYEPDTAVTID